jgi:L-ascorbate metabolism protein UlaG (beta-lactamase superfamily)
MDRRKFLQSALAATVSFAGIFSGSVWIFLRESKFGSQPAGARRQRILASPNYRNGEFQNLQSTQMMTGESGGLKGLVDFFFKKGRRRPLGPIPSVRRDLLHLPADRNVLVWFGHSSYFLQVDGKRILVDPVLSGSASPVPATTRAFPGSDAYTVADLPPIDYLVITHDHWDHLDYDTVLKLRPNVKRVITGLGVGQHLESWGYSPAAISEGDWGNTFDLGDGFTASIRTARHFSGRTFKRNQSLWISIALKTSSGYKIFLGGDGGYGPHFKQIGNEFGGFDLAMLEDGQYDRAWRYIHMLPEETLRAAQDLGARHFFPVHNSKFCISNHDWDAPLRTITSLAADARPRMLTPVIGELVDLRAPATPFEEWWRNVV